MMQQNIIPCKHCGKQTSHQRLDPSMPKEGRECSKCWDWVCGDCVDWNQSDVNSIICSRCSGRAAPKGCGCD
jgi:hypothetical protein